MGAAIEASLALLQIPVETFFANPVESTQVPFGLVPKAFDAVDMVATCGNERLIVVHTSVTELRDIQRVLRTEAVSIHNAIGSNPLTDERHPRLRFGMGDDGGYYMTAPF